MIRRWTAAIPGGRLPSQARSAMACGRGSLGRSHTAPTRVTQIRISPTIGYLAMSLPMGVPTSPSYERGPNRRKATAQTCAFAVDTGTLQASSAATPHTRLAGSPMRHPKLAPVYADFTDHIFRLGVSYKFNEPYAPWK